MRTNDITAAIIESAVEVHRVLGGPGLLESFYEEALAVELGLRGFIVERQVPVPAVYKGVQLKTPLRIDVLVNDTVVVECKATSRNSEAFAPQTVTYLRLRRRRISLVINFGKRSIRQNVRRFVDDFDEECAATP